MKSRIWTGLMLAGGSLLMFAGPALAIPPKIQGAAVEWVVASDLPPFALIGAGGGEGGTGVSEEYFDENPANGGGGADYEDPSRYMFVTVRVDRDVRTHYLQYFFEAPYRNDNTGKFSKNLSVVSVSGQPVLSWCYKPPQCMKREYSWRSGANLVVKITCDAIKREGPPTARGVRIPCPEPTEILDAYLARYPSSLEEEVSIPLLSWLSDAARAREHVRTEVALELAAARYWIAMAKRKGVQNLESDDLRTIEFHLQEFASLRGKLMSGASGASYEEKLSRLRAMAPDKRFAGMKRMATGFGVWWLLHHPATPIHVPELPPVPATVVPTTAAPSPVLTPTAMATP